MAEYLPYLTIAAIILSPLIAVQVEKFLERRRSDKERKLNIFKTLMATRGWALDHRHVEALNMIDLEFTKVETVITQWKAYLDHLNQMPLDTNSDVKDEEQKSREQTQYDTLMSTWRDKREDYFVDLLFEMGKLLKYKFDKTHIKRSIYTPKGHADTENEQQFLRKASIELLKGRLKLPVLTTSPGLSDEEIEANKTELNEQKLIRELLIKHYQGEIPTVVKIIEDGNTEKN